MAVMASMSVWRPRSGKFQDFMAKVTTAKKIHERLGAKVRVWQNQFGGEPMSVGYVIEHASWADFGKFGEKVEKDAEWQSFWAEALAAPTADLIQHSVWSETLGA